LNWEHARAPHRTRLGHIAPLGERLSALRLCEATALATVRHSLAQHGQLSALTLFAAGDGLEIIDGFKRVRAARAGAPAGARQTDLVRGHA
jgi:hypothetical protein